MINMIYYNTTSPVQSHVCILVSNEHAHQDIAWGSIGTNSVRVFHLSVAFARGWGGDAAVARRLGLTGICGSRAWRHRGGDGEWRTGGGWIRVIERAGAKGARQGRDLAAGGAPLVVWSHGRGEQKDCIRIGGELITFRKFNFHSN
jgi:hypothetical protein